MRSVIIDCDPGIDDALAIALALQHPDVEVHAITTVSGNVPLESVTRNALDLVSFFGSPDLPVFAGSESPLERDAVRAGVHGSTGLGGYALPQSSRNASTGAVDFLIEAVMASEEDEITLVAIGPLTNLAVALQREPRIADRVKEVVVMGGGRGVGNMTPVAEFNIFADPHAAEVVLSGGWQIVMIGLDLTWQSGISQVELDRLRSIPGPRAEAVLAWVEHYAMGETNPTGGGPAVHDVCAVAWVIDPSMFVTVPAHVQVETHGALTLGETVVDLGEYGGEPNALWAVSLDRDRFWNLMISTLDTSRNSGITYPTETGPGTSVQ